VRTGGDVTSVQIGDVVCEPGSKRSGTVTVASLPGGDVAFPVGVVVGAARGPTVAVVAGVHGSEYAGIEAATRVFRDLEPEALSGTVIVVPVANTAAFFARTALVNPVDGVNLNRVFPGEATGTVSPRLAKALMDTVVSRADAVLDLHGSDLFEEQVPNVTVLVGGEEQDGPTLAIARAFGTEFLRRKNVSTARGTLIAEAFAAGKPAIMSEIGGGGRFDEDEIMMQVRGTQNVLMHLGLLEGPVTPLEAFERQRVGDEESLVATDSGGVFHPLVEVRSWVDAGEPVANVTDVWGSVLETAYAPRAGLVRLMFMKRLVNPGNALMTILHV